MPGQVKISALQMVAQVAGSPSADNAHITAEFTPSAGSTYALPTDTGNTRKWDVFAGDLGFTYDGLDGYFYGLLGDSYGHDWNGPDTTHSRAGNTTLAAGMNAVNVNTFTGSQSILLAAAGSFTSAGGVAAVLLSTTGKLAYIRYTSRTTTTLFNCTLIYGTGVMTTGDTIRGDDAWTSAGWRSNTLFRSATTDLSAGYTISDFRPLTSSDIAKQAIPGTKSIQLQTNPFPGSKTISTTSVTSNVVTVTTSAAHRLVVGQPVVVAGVTNTAFNGNYTVATTPTATTFTYALTLANTSSTAGTVIGRANITSISSAGYVTTVTTAIPHGLVQGQGVVVAGTSHADGERPVYTVTSTTVYTLLTFLTSGSASTGTSQPAANSYAATPGSLNEGSLIPSGAIAYDTGGGAIRHVAFYWIPSWFSTTGGLWYTNYMGIAYSDDAGVTWTRQGVTGGSYQTVDTAAVWANNASYTDGFQQGWPVDGNDGYFYVMCCPNGRFGTAKMMRVLKANVLTKSSYTYWDGSTWNSSQAAAVTIFGDAQPANPVGEPSIIFHQGTGLYVTTYLDQTIYGIVLRTSATPQGPWTDKQTILLSAAFGNSDLYGGFIHPWSSKAPNQGGDLYFHVSLFAPYGTFLMRAQITPVAKRSSFLRMLGAN